jgi:ABC-type transporter Mla maintaining outer membrane lipid asymmetry ATPase subunit MlaF
MSPVIELRDVRCDGAEGTEPLALSLSVAEGTAVVLLGPARSGVRTVLRLCAGLLVPDDGTVRVLGRDPAKPDDETALDVRLRVSVVLQPPGLLSNMTVFNNVALPVRYHSGREEGDIEPVVMRLLTDLGLDSIRDQFPAALTLGEAKAVALARALVMEPEVLLMEEPDAGLDAESMERCQAVIQEARARRPLALLAAMSHPSPLQALADRVVYMRGGRVVAEGPRADLLKSATGDMLAYLGA